jgi:hypothetical protein
MRIAMASKSSQPALYEKMRSRPAGSIAPAPMKIDIPPDLPPIEVAGSWLRPGQMIRLPAGYVLLAAGIVIILSAFAYMVGHSRGQAVERRKYEDGVRGKIDGGPVEAAYTLDPMTESVSGSQQQPVGSGSRSGSNPAAASGVKASHPSSWGAIEPRTDPRKKGLNYFVLAETTQAGAVRLADFCRSQGLETYVVSGKNDRRRVVAFPGFGSSARSSAEVKALEALIHTVGDKWKRTQKGDTDLRDAYPALHGG